MCDVAGIAQRVHPSPVIEVLQGPRHVCGHDSSVRVNKPRMYITQRSQHFFDDGDELVFGARRDGAWSKFRAQIVPVGLGNILVAEGWIDLVVLGPDLIELLGKR